MAWLGLAIAAGAAAYLHFNRPAISRPEAVSPPASPTKQENAGAVPRALPAPPVSRAAPPAKSVQIVLTAHQPSWVEVTADGKTAFTGTLEPNDSRSIAADGLVKLVTGNAGGIAISLNGKALDPIGPPGQVMDVRLTAEGLQSVQKIQPAFDPL
jgi:hypothetical protein